MLKKREMDGRYYPERWQLNKHSRHIAGGEVLLIAILSLLVSYSIGWTGEFIDSKPYWIYFADKGYQSDSEIDVALNDNKDVVSDRSLARRSRTGAINILSEFDLPVKSEFILQISEVAAQPVRHLSRWLNAISVKLTEEEVSRIREFPFVTKVDPVRSFMRVNDDLNVQEEADIDPYIPRRDPNLNYGTSIRQNAFINAPELHDRGYFGRGVLIGICDAGFDNLDHNCFAETDVITSWDFVNDDGEVGDEDDMGDGNHGTKILSIIGGFEEGRLIGIAPQASFVLAKTENTEREVEVEEDHWVAAVEWMDSLGVDIITSSLSYSDWYEYEEMDGETAVTTIAADIASELGIVVLNAMGNSGRSDYPENKMGAPADGDYVFSIGATNSDSTRTSFSSHGPTWDRRIKPDLMSFGSSVKFASSRNDEDYGAGAGTSFSTPAIAGLCALLIEAGPYFSPVTLLDALKESAHYRDEPDTLMGWGIPDGLAVLGSLNLPQIELDIDMRAGWTTISHNLVGNAGFDIVDIFAPLVERGHLLLVKDQDGLFYSPAVEFNNIPFWNAYQGYQVQLSDADVLVLEGELSHYRNPIQLPEGWNLVAYKPNFTLSAEPAYQSLTGVDALVIAKDHRGRFYLPAFNFSNMSELRPGRGYHVKLSEAATLVYPRRRVVPDYEQNRFVPIPSFLPVMENGRSSMSLLLLGDNSIIDGDEVGCYNSDGMLVGSGVFHQGRCGIAVWSDSGAPILEFSIFRRVQEGYTKLTPELRLIAGSADYTPDSYSVFKLSIPRAEAQHNTLSFSVTTSPNPFNETCIISYHNSISSPIQINVYDILGRSVIQPIRLNEHPVDGILPIYASDWAAGDYFVRVRNGEMKIDITIHHIK